MRAAWVRAGTAAAGIPLLVRLVGAALLAATAVIHLYLWSTGYRSIAWIGPLFLADVVMSAVLALAVLAAPARWLPWACAAGALLQAGTLGGLLLSVSVGFLGFVETWTAPLTVPSVAVEGAGAVVLGVFAAAELVRSRHRRPTDRTRMRPSRGVIEGSAAAAAAPRRPGARGRPRSAR